MLLHRFHVLSDYKHALLYGWSRLFAPDLTHSCGETTTIEVILVLSKQASDWNEAWTAVRSLVIMNLERISRVLYRSPMAGSSAFSALAVIRLGVEHWIMPSEQMIMRLVHLTSRQFVPPIISGRGKHTATVWGVGVDCDIRDQSLWSHFRHSYCRWIIT